MCHFLWFNYKPATCIESNAKDGEPIADELNFKSFPISLHQKEDCRNFQL